MTPPEQRLDAALRAARAQLAACSDTAHADALWLWEHALGRSRAWLLAHPEHVLSAAEARRGAALVRARAQGVSVAQLCGRADFLDLELRLRPAAPCPRPETELLVAAALRGLPGRARVLEWGTGCGAVALALARARPDCRIVAHDCRRAAVRLAQANAHRLRVRRARFARADWRRRWRGGRYHLILANPPYVAPHDPHLHGPGVRREPRAALIATERGCAALRTLALRARRHARPGARLLLEHGRDQGTQARRIVSRAGWGRVRTLADAEGRPRACLASV